MAYHRQRRHLSWSSDSPPSKHMQRRWTPHKGPLAQAAPGDLYEEPEDGHAAGSDGWSEKWRQQRPILEMRGNTPGNPTTSRSVCWSAWVASLGALGSGLL